jgi:6-phosphofructokinase 1
MIVEVMGRDAGWIAMNAGIAGGATAIVVPEVPFDVADVAATVARRHHRGRYASVLVVAEGAKPRPGTMQMPTVPLDSLGREIYGNVAHSVAYAMAPEIARLTGYEARVVQLGHVQRGGTPNAYDRVLSTRFGLAAVDAVVDRAWGDMVVLRSGRIERARMALTRGRSRTIDLEVFSDVASTFFG